MANVGGVGGVLQELISPTRYPKVPNAPRVDPQAAQRTAIEGNLEALPALEQLGSKVDTYNLTQRRNQLNQAIPGFNGLLQQGTSNLNDWLRGNISVADTGGVIRDATGRSIAGGYGGSPAAANLTARDLGMTEYGVQRAATAALPGYLGSVANLLMPHPFEVQSGFLSPAQQISAEQWNEIYRYKQEALVNEIAALPDPLIAAVGEAVGSNFNQDTGALRNWSTFGIGSKEEGGTAGGGGGGLQSYSPMSSLDFSNSAPNQGWDYTPNSPTQGAGGDSTSGLMALLGGMGGGGGGASSAMAFI